MEPLLYVMAILGCGDGDAGCVRARVEPTVYSSLAACRRAMPAGIARNTDLSFPVIAADCEAGGAQIAHLTVRTKGRG